MANVGLVHGVDEEISNHRVEGHGKDAQDHHGDDKVRLFGQQRGEQGVSGCSQGIPDGRGHDEHGHQDHEKEHHPH